MQAAYQYVPEWRDDQRSGRYPFADAAPLTARTGLQLRRDCFLDALVYPPGALPATGLTRLEVAPREVTAYVGDARDARRASTAFDPLDAPELLRLATPDGRAAGVLVADPLVLAELQVWPRGGHDFAPGAAEFAAGVVLPSPGVGVAGFLLDDGTLVTGDVWLVAEDGVVVRTTDDGDVRVDVVGDPDFRRRQCVEAGLYEPRRVVRTINGISPDARGGFQFVEGRRLAGDSILRVVPERPDGVRIYAAGKSAGRP